MIYLKATDEATLTAALKTAGWAWDTEYQLDEDSNRVQADGANLLLHGEELPAALADMVIEAPANPVRRFA